MPDDAVALRRDVAHDLRDRLGGDGDPAELGLAHDVIHRASLDDK